MVRSFQVRSGIGLLWWLATTVVAACDGVGGPYVTPCTSPGLPVNLSVGSYVSIDPGPDDGCTVFPANGPIAAEYLLVPQLVTGAPGGASLFRLFGDTIRPPLSASAATISGNRVAVDRPPSPAEQFHSYLRLADERRSWGFQPDTATAVAALRAAQAAGPPAMGSQRQFMVCATTDCRRFDRVTAHVRALKSKVAIYVDLAAPANGLDSLALDSIANVFDQRLYGIDTAAFGVESDIDSNTVVLVLMTNVLNKMVTAKACNETGFIAGFFLGADLDPAFRNDSRSNKGEVFYSIVADPTGKLSCSHSVAELQAFVPVTFIHEFQHMISFNQHVLKRGGNGEVLWLNEGFSHYAEELGGRSYETTPTAPLADCVVGTWTCRFYIGDLHNAYTYLDSTSRHYLLPKAGTGTLSERGAAWLFVRYVVDRYSGGSTMGQWNALTRQLLQTTNVGAANVAAVTGEPFSTVVSRWALANWVSELPGFAAAPELRYDSWLFRPTFASLHSQRPDPFPKDFPLEPTVSSGRDVAVWGALLGGSGVYHRATQAPTEPGFTLHFTAPFGAMINASLEPRLNVIRIQ